MDLLKKLSIEFPGIRDCIRKYTSKGNVPNYLNQLETAIDHKDLEAIHFLLDKIYNWYNENQRNIQSNEFVYNKREHISNQDILKKYIVDFKDYKIEYNDESSITEKSIQSISDNIFIVHGRDEGKKYGLAYFLKKLKVNPIILHEKPNGGLTVIEKLEKNSENVNCAIFLFTGDDEGKLKKDEDLNSRARQNVVFEAGFFAGKIGRKRTIALVEEGVEQPGDLSGVVYVNLDSKERWHYDVAKELREMGYNIDMNDI